MAAPRYDATTNQMVRVDTANPAVLNTRQRFTAAQVNAGATVLAAVGGYAYRVISAKLVAIGGAAAGATAVVLLGTRSGAVTLMSVAVAGLTQSALVDLDDAAAAALADGASFTPLDANTAITIGKTGGSLTGATSIDVILQYVLE